MTGEVPHVHFLGTAGALPTPQRNLPCIMVRRGSDTLLFDCGEGAQETKRTREYRFHRVSIS